MILNNISLYLRSERLQSSWKIKSAEGEIFYKTVRKDFYEDRKKYT